MPTVTNVTEEESRRPGRHCKRGRRPGQGARRWARSLLLGIYEDGALIPVGTGWTAQAASAPERGRVRRDPVFRKRCRAPLDLDRSLRDRLVRFAVHQREDDCLPCALHREIGRDCRFGGMVQHAVLEDESVA